MWDVLRAAGGQLRTMATIVVGLDMGAVLALGAAMGANRRLLAEVLAEAEPIIVSKINERLRSGSDG
ncbi:DUF7697 family protein [Xanthobacter autotrophicus]|uniref:DUF7697 family protein n=1 Tax=Xanthobacter autotrophicus TaxID=280 RepID=UPI0037265A23